MSAKSEIPAEFQNQKILKFAESADSAKHTLRGIPQGELDSLRKKIAQANGKVVILVHPYWSIAQKSSYKSTIEKLLRRSKAPVIIIEESPKIPRLKEKLAGLKAPNNLIIASSEGRSDIWVGVPRNRHKQVALIQTTRHLQNFFRRLAPEQYLSEALV